VLSNNPIIVLSLTCIYLTNFDSLQGAFDVIIRYLTFDWISGNFLYSRCG